MAYLKRIVDDALSDYLATFGGVLIEGIRGCGKTSTALNHAQSSVKLDESPEVLKMADLAPEVIMEGEVPRLIDEWQLAPSLWNTARHTIDKRQKVGQFIFSGSATPADDLTRHSGAGRFGRLLMRTMTLSESGASTVQVSMRELAEAGREESNPLAVSAKSSLSYFDLAAIAVQGGWPGLLGASQKQATLFNSSYAESLYSAQLDLEDSAKHDPQRMRRVMQSLARNTASEVSLATIAADVSGGEVSISTSTVREYLNTLTRVFALEELPAWSVSLRSKSRLRTTPKLMFSEPSIGLAVLGVGSDSLARDPEFFGQVFEAMVVRDLRSFAQLENANVYHYRDNTGLEADAIIEYPDGSWAAVEVKLGSAKIAEAERALLTLKNERVDTKKVGAPLFMAVVTATEYAYVLESGIYVLPLGVLGA